MPKIYIASDHRGFAARHYLIENFSLPPSYRWVDLGDAEPDPSDDYTEYAARAAISVLKDPGSLGVIICGSGHGVSIQANRFKGIRAILGLSPRLAELGREHNDANILCLSADFQNFSELSSTLYAFLTTKFSGEERHRRRIAALDKEYSL